MFFCNSTNRNNFKHFQAVVYDKLPGFCKYRDNAKKH